MHQNEHDYVSLYTHGYPLRQHYNNWVTTTLTPILGNIIHIFYDECERENGWQVKKADPRLCDWSKYKLDIIVQSNTGFEQHSAHLLIWNYDSEPYHFCLDYDGLSHIDCPQLLPSKNYTLDDLRNIMDIVNEGFDIDHENYYGGTD